MNVELTLSHGSFDVVAALELPTLPSPGQRIVIYSDSSPPRHYEILEAWWCELSEQRTNIQGSCIVTPIHMDV